MHRSGNRTFDRPATRPMSHVTIAGRLFGFFLAAAALSISCSPGSLPPDFQVGGAGGGTPTGGMGGGTPTGGMGGGTPTGGMGGGDVLSKALTGCAAYATVGDFETKLLVPKCGTSGCHTPTGGLSPPDLMSPNSYSRILDKNVAYMATMCDKTKDKYVNSGDTAENSFFVSKVRDKSPKCSPAGPVSGTQMPFVPPLLPQSDIDCTVAYVKAILGK
jgi:hypothetical protein